MQLGINDVVDTISADHLDRLRKHLAPLLSEPLLLDAVMMRVADNMHDAASTAYACGESAARDAEPEVLSTSWLIQVEIDPGEWQYYSQHEWPTEVFCSRYGSWVSLPKVATNS